MRLDALLSATARANPGREALAAATGGETLRYADLLALAETVAARLAQAGLARDEPVHLRVSNHGLDFVAFLGLWLAGAVVVPGTRVPDSTWTRAQGLAMSCALIVKYRDARTDARAALEAALR